MPRTCKGLYREYRDGAGTPWDDEELMDAVRNHSDRSFWKTYKSRPDIYAALRRYGSYLRREARKRGLM